MERERERGVIWNVKLEGEREKGRERCNSECKNEERARGGGVILSVKLERDRQTDRQTEM